MPAARIIDGKAIAAEIRREIAARASRLSLKPGLATVLVGEDPGSKIYVANKHKACAEAGFTSFEHHFPKGLSQGELLALIARLNADPKVHGILVQLPLPKPIEEKKVLAAVDPMKDVDGFHPMSLGKLLAGDEGPLPCTPAGC